MNLLYMCGINDIEHHLNNVLSGLKTIRTYKRKTLHLDVEEGYSVKRMKNFENESSLCRRVNKKYYSSVKGNRN